MGVACLEKNIFLIWDPGGRELLIVRRQVPLCERVSMGVVGGPGEGSAGSSTNSEVDAKCQAHGSVAPSIRCCSPRLSSTI